jgi:hypothetical protein
MARTPEYYAFFNARDRCTKPKNRAFKNYGGRGIEFRFASFEEFFAELGPRPQGTELERINNDGHYEPGNVRWATHGEQQVNRRRGLKRQHSSKYPGVSWHKSNSNWRAAATIKGVHHHFGSSDSEYRAAKLYVEGMRGLGFTIKDPKLD